MKRSIGWALGVCLVGGSIYLGHASSHREAPLISADPLADNTDTYAFVSPDAPDTVTLIANWIPLEAPGGGPNFYKFGDDVLYRKDKRPFKEDLPKLFELLAAGTIRPRIAARLSLLDGREGQRLLEAGGVAGKIVLLAGPPLR